MIKRILLMLVGVFFLLLLTGCENSSENLAALAAKENYEDYLDRVSFNGAVLIAKEGQTLLSQGFGMANQTNGERNKASTQFRIGSLTKQFTAMAIVLLQEQGLLNVDDPISMYIPNYPDGNNITIRHLLNHSAGIPNFTALESFPEIKEKTMSLPELLALFKDRPLEFEPGSQFSYSNSGYIILGLIIEDVSEMFYGDYLKQEIFTPLEMHDTEYGNDTIGVENRAVGYQGDFADAGYSNMSVPHAAGALASTVLDLQKWDAALHDNTLVSAEMKTEIFTPHGGDYSFGWTIEDYDGQPYQHHEGGIDGFRSFIARYPESQILIIVLSNNQDFPVRELSKNLASRLLKS